MSVATPAWSTERLATVFAALGLRAGDCVLVHSALRRLRPLPGGAAAVIAALDAVLGPSGTLVMPTHTWGTPCGNPPVFDPALTPACTGALTEVFRQQHDVQRSRHPTHSLAARGPRATELLADHDRDQTRCAPHGPYGRLIAWDARVLIIGADLRCCTLFHCCEELAHVPPLPADAPAMTWIVRTESGDRTVVQRDHGRNTWDQYPRLEQPLIACGALRVHVEQECAFRLLSTAAAAAWLVPALQADPQLLLAADG